MKFINFFDNFDNDGNCSFNYYLPKFNKNFHFKKLTFHFIPKYQTYVKGFIVINLLSVT